MFRIPVFGLGFVVFFLCSIVMEFHSWNTLGFFALYINKNILKFLMKNVFVLTLMKNRITFGNLRNIKGIPLIFFKLNVFIVAK